MWSVLLLTTSMCHYSFPKQFFSYCFCMLSKFANVFESKVWRVQVAHLHNATRALSSWSRYFQLSTNLDFFCYLWYYGKKQIKIGMWFSVVCTLIDNDAGHHSGQNLLWNHFLFRHIDKAWDVHFQILSSCYNHLVKQNMTPFSADESMKISIITGVIILITIIPA